jgi:RNA polymerase sigma-70 factor (ECF subfamily)
VSLPADRLAEHGAELYRLAYALTGSPHDADDLVQETFARVLARPRVVRRQDGPRYLRRALRNTWIDMQRARAARPVSAGDGALERVSGGDPSGLVLDIHIALDAISGLTPRLRAAIAAVDLLGMPYRDAARALGIRLGTLQSRLSRAREQVATALLADAPA